MIRSICYFSPNPGPWTVTRLQAIAAKLQAGLGLEVQTLRICAPNCGIADLEARFADYPALLLSVGQRSIEAIKAEKADFYASPRCFFHASPQNESEDRFWTDFLFETAQKAPLKTFHYALNFLNPLDSPFFPSAQASGEGFSIGFQACDWASNCENEKQWLDLQKEIWARSCELLADEADFLGIDSSIAPLGGEQGSLIAHVLRWKGSLQQAVLSDFFLGLTQFIKAENPKPLGLNGLMLPCLEDFLLAQHYEKGQFSLERNLFLSLHSGLGIDTYPFGLDQNPETVLQLIGLLRGLSYKHQKTLSMRLISDGKSKIGMRSQFENKYLADAILQPLNL